MSNCHWQSRNQPTQKLRDLILQFFISKLFSINSFMKYIFLSLGLLFEGGKMHSPECQGEFHRGQTWRSFFDVHEWVGLLCSSVPRYYLLVTCKYKFKSYNNQLINLIYLWLYCCRTSLCRSSSHSPKLYQWIINIQHFLDYNNVMELISMCVWSCNNLYVMSYNRQSFA